LIVLSTSFTLIIDKPRPYFAEIPYALWGEVNYDSDGDCKHPTDQDWTCLQLTNRETDQQLEITSAQNEYRIESEEPPLAAQATAFLKERTSATVRGDPPGSWVGSWTYVEANARTDRVRAEFPRPELKPFDHHYFWGSWKWVGAFATEYTWTGRWIMNSLLTQDKRAVFLCIHWLKAPPTDPIQSAALRYALGVFTGLNFNSDNEWIAWYEGSLLRSGGRKLYPEPDLKAWHEDLKRC
jgi:hypothetical protein